MKRFLPLCLLLSAARPGMAQTNALQEQAGELAVPTNVAKTFTTAAAGLTNAADLRTHIHSDSGFFDMTGYRTIYVGHVRVDDPKMKLTSAWLAADLPHGDKPDRHIVATTNVVIDLMGGTNQPWHVTSDRSVYDLKLVDKVTNEIVTLTGHARAESTQYIVTGEPLIYDMQNHLFSGTNYTTIFKSTNSIGLGTNAFRANTNSDSAQPPF